MLVTGVLGTTGLTEPLEEGGLQRLIGIGVADTAGQRGTQQMFGHGHNHTQVPVRLSRAPGHTSPQTAAIDDHDLLEVQRHWDRVTSESVPLIAISRSGITANRADTTAGPESPLEA
jgi:hypothetical protein